MTYRETLDFLYGSLPVYQRVGKAAYKASLDNTLELDAYFGHPHRKFPSIHVAGTNGKGSVCHMLASVCQHAGYRTGLYTSPHLLDFRERIRVNGTPVPEEEVTGFVTRHRNVIGSIRPSFFEMTVAMAFDWFARQKVEVAVVETGLGGRLDSTNILTPELAVITNVSYDHAEFLGKDLRSIAREKGGIIKEGVPLVTGPMEDGVRDVLLEMAEARKAPVTDAGRLMVPVYHTFDMDGRMVVRIRHTESGRRGEVTCDLGGEYQQENLVTALAAFDLLRTKGWHLREEALEGLSNIRENTGLLGRWQTVGHNPRSICDMAHNEAGIRAVIRQIEQIPRRDLHLVWGMVADKDPGRILPLLPREASYYFTKPGVPRAMAPEELRNKASVLGLEGDAYETVPDAYRRAAENAGPDDLIFTGGSTFVVADLLEALGYRPASG